jgi:hypothetical protein
MSTCRFRANRFKNSAQRTRENHKPSHSSKRNKINGSVLESKEFGERMNFSRAFDPIEVAKILVLAFSSLLSLSSASLAQGSVVNSMGASNCPTADFDTSLNFASEPSNYYAIIVDKQNISSHSCIFDGPVYGPTFYPDRVLRGSPVRAALRL